MCPDCSLVPIKLLGAEDRLSADIRAFSHAIDSEAGVINHSWGYYEAIPVPTPLKNIIVKASTEGREGKEILVFLLLNDDRESWTMSSAPLMRILCVSAIDNYGRPTNTDMVLQSMFLPRLRPSHAQMRPKPINLVERRPSSVVSGLAAWALSERPDLHSSS